MARASRVGCSRWRSRTACRGGGEEEESEEQRWPWGSVTWLSLGSGLCSPCHAGCRSCAVTHAHTTAHCSGCKFRNSYVKQFWEMVQFRNTSAVVRFLFPPCSPSPSLSPFSLTPLFKKIFFPLPMNAKISLQTHPTWCDDREAQVKPEVLAALRHWGQSGGQHSDKEVTRTSRSISAAAGGAEGLLWLYPGGSTFLCTSHSAYSWNCEP